MQCSVIPRSYKKKRFWRQNIRATVGSSLAVVLANIDLIFVGRPFLCPLGQFIFFSALVAETIVVKSVEQSSIVVRASADRFYVDLDKSADGRQIVYGFR